MNCETEKGDRNALFQKINLRFKRLPRTQRTRHTTDNIDDVNSTAEDDNSTTPTGAMLMTTCNVVALTCSQQHRALHGMYVVCALQKFWGSSCVVVAYMLSAQLAVT